MFKEYLRAKLQAPVSLLCALQWYLHYKRFAFLVLATCIKAPMVKAKIFVLFTYFVRMLVGCFGFIGPLNSISVFVGPSPREGEKEERKDRRE